MWRSGWVWITTRKRRRVSDGHDPAEMGVDFGLDAALESRLPPLMELAAAGRRDPSEAMRPLGTDQRSRLA
jgi:hypothetical protein